MSLVIEKLTEYNIDKFLHKIITSIKKEYYLTYNRNVSVSYIINLRDYCIKYMYVLKFNSYHEKLIGYFTLSDIDFFKTQYFTSYILQYILNFMNNTMYIFDVYIFPKYRRKGIGIYLVKRAVEIAEKNNNTTRICLYTRTEELSNFYSKNGFLRVKRLEVNGQYLYLHERMKVI